MTSLKIIGLIFLTVWGAAAVSQAAATNRYVAANSTAPAWPYDSWANAATNIKPAVDAANANNAGDLVIISNGTYYLTEQISVSNTVVTNYSGNQALVIVNGNYPEYTNRCFYLNHANAVISGLTITNGYANNLSGGGVLVNYGRVHDCVVSGCRSLVTTAFKGGGGIYLYRGTVTCSSIIGNTADGGGVANGTSSGAGGIFTEGGGATMVSNCIIGWNIASNGVYCGGIKMSGNATVENSQISSNYAYVYAGGGVVMRAGNNILQNCLINGNTCTVNSSGGAGVCLQDTGGAAGNIIRNCLIIQNNALHSSGYGGGINISQVPAEISFCTIAANSGPYGSGIFFATTVRCQTNIFNCIIRNYLYDITGGANTTSIVFSAVNSTNGFYPAYGSWTIAGKITNDPLFKDESGGDYRLQKNSACINAGTNQSWMINASDLDGRHRQDKFSGLVDMGCYEYLSSGAMFRFK